MASFEPGARMRATMRAMARSRSGEAVVARVRSRRSLRSVPNTAATWPWGREFAGAANVVAYLGRSTHKTAIGNHRLVDFDGEHVRLRWRDYAHGNKRKVTRLDAAEFVRRFLLHVLPRGFTRLRHYGVLANRGRARNLALCRALLEQPATESREPETPQAMMLRLTGIDITVCRHCGVGVLNRMLLLAPQFRAAMPVSRGRPP